MHILDGGGVLKMENLAFLVRELLVPEVKHRVIKYNAWGTSGISKKALSEFAGV